MEVTCQLWLSVLSFHLGERLGGGFLPPPGHLTDFVHFVLFYVFGLLK